MTASAPLTSDGIFNSCSNTIVRGTIETVRNIGIDYGKRRDRSKSTCYHKNHKVISGNATADSTVTVSFPKCVDNASANDSPVVISHWHCGKEHDQCPLPHCLLRGPCIGAQAPHPGGDPVGGLQKGGGSPLQVPYSEPRGEDARHSGAPFPMAVPDDSCQSLVLRLGAGSAARNVISTEASMVLSSGK